MQPSVDQESGAHVQRAPQTAVASAGTGAVANAISNSITSAIVANNPELAPYAPVLGTVVGGALAGFGNAARTRLAKGQGGPLDLVAHLFRFLG